MPSLIFSTTPPHQRSSFMFTSPTISNSDKYSILVLINESSIFCFPICCIFSRTLVSPISSLCFHSFCTSLLNSISLAFAFWSKYLTAFDNFPTIGIYILCGAFVGGSSGTCHCLVSLIISIKLSCNSGIVFFFPFLDHVVLASTRPNPL